MFFKKKKARPEKESIVITNEKNYKQIEEYNRLKDNIMFLNADGKNKIIQIESAMPHEGKTSVLCNLAVALGLTDKKVVVVDLDFRRPKIHKRFEVSNKFGIAEFMLGEVQKEDIVKETKYKNVSVVTRGGEINNASLVLTSKKFKTFVKGLAKEYDFVLIDSAPILQVSDYIHILSVSNGVLFVVAFGETTKRQITEAINELKKNNANILGTVFSKYDKKKDGGYYEGNTYGSGYYNYYVKKAEKEAEQEESENK